MSEDEEDDSVTQDDEGAPEPTVDASPTPTPTPTPTPEEPLEPEPEEADAEPEPELETDPAEDTDVPDETEPEEPEAFSFECPRTSINAGEQATLTINAPSGTQLSLGPGGSSLGASVSLSGSQLTYTAPESVTGTQQDTLTINGTSADGETFRVLRRHHRQRRRRSQPNAGDGDGAGVHSHTDPARRRRPDPRH